MNVFIGGARSHLEMCQSEVIQKIFKQLLFLKGTQTCSDSDSHLIDTMESRFPCHLKLYAKYLV